MVWVGFLLVREEVGIVSFAHTFGSDSKHCHYGAERDYVSIRFSRAVLLRVPFKGWSACVS